MDQDQTPPKPKRANYVHVKAARRKAKEILVAEAGGACVRCGYNKCLRALTFHHRDPAEKEFTIRSKIRKLDTLRKEAAKCDLLCANCHAEVHELADNVLG